MGGGATGGWRDIDERWCNRWMEEIPMGQVTCPIKVYQEAKNIIRDS